MERTIHAVKAVEKPLARPDNVDELDIGGKSRDKLKEIITTGSFRRNQSHAQDEHRKTVQLVRRTALHKPRALSLSENLLPAPARLLLRYALDDEPSSATL